MGARFEALDEGVLAAASKSIGYFFAISIFLEGQCSHMVKSNHGHNIMPAKLKRIYCATQVQVLTAEATFFLQIVLDGQKVGFGL